MISLQLVFFAEQQKRSGGSIAEQLEEKAEAKTFSAPPPRSTQPTMRLLQRLQFASCN